MTTPIAAPIPAIEFDAPLVNPAPSGLYSVTSWVDLAEGEPVRWLGGVRIRVHNYGGKTAFGVWSAEWCADPGDNIKDGTRPPQPDPFAPVVVWAFDECDMTAPSQVEVRERAQQNLRLLEQTAVETEFAARLVADAPPVPAPDDLVACVGHLEAELAKTDIVGFIHASAAMAAQAASANVAIRSGTALKSPMGHTWVFGGGYVDALGAALVATSPTFGWRDAVQVREAFDETHNRFLVVAERSVVIGYERAVALAWVE